MLTFGKVWVGSLSVSCKTSREFAKAVKDNEEFIIIEGDLKNHVYRIKATGKVAWVVCFSALAIAITSIPGAVAAKAVPGGAGRVGGNVFAVCGVAAPAVAAATLGSAFMPAITIGLAAGGIGVLNTLRDKYRIVENNDSYMELQKI